MTRSTRCSRACVKDVAHDRLSLVALRRQVEEGGRGRRTRVVQGQVLQCNTSSRTAEDSEARAGVRSCSARRRVRLPWSADPRTQAA